MKILYWTSQYWPDLGGLEVLALETLPALRERGYEFAVVCEKGARPMPDFCEQDGIPVHRLNFSPAFAARDIHQIFAIQKRVAEIKTAFAADLVHLNFVRHGPYFHIKTQKVHPAPMLLGIHSDFVGVRAGPDTLFGQCLRSADWICGVSHATLNDVLEYVPEQIPRSSVIFNGLAMPTLEPAPLPFDPPHIVCLGRLAHQKGFDIALEAFVRVLERFPSVRLTFVGEGEMRPDLELQTRVLKLEDRVTFTGQVDRDAIAPIINTATIVLVPSRYREPFALVALEAAQMERPVVATRWGGLTETVADGQSGILVENENVAAFAEAMVFLLQNPATATSMGKRGRERARDLFGLKRCVNAYDSLYQQLIHEEKVKRLERPSSAEDVN